MTHTSMADAKDLQELDANSLVAIDAGSPLTDIGWKLLEKAAECIMDNWGEFKAGLSQGYNTPI